MVFRSPWRSMLKPATGLPVLAMLLDDAVGPLRLDADHDHGGHVRIAADAGQRAEGQLQVLAELQPAVGVRQRHGALDQAATPSAAALEMSSTGRMMTWLRMPKRPFSRR